MPSGKGTSRIEGRNRTAAAGNLRSGPGTASAKSELLPGLNKNGVSFPEGSRVGVRFRSPTLDLSGQFSNRYFFKKGLSLRREVAIASPELTKETNGIHDSEFSYERISRSLCYLRDWIKVCIHYKISEMKPRTEMGVALRL